MANFEHIAQLGDPSPLPRFPARCRLYFLIHFVIYIYAIY